MDYDSVADAFRDLRSEVDELEDAVKNGTQSSGDWNWATFSSARLMFRVL